MIQPTYPCPPFTGLLPCSNDGFSAPTKEPWRRITFKAGRDRLSGEVEVDETLVGGEERGGKRGRGAGRKSIVVIAVEVLSPKGFGRIRMGRVPDASGASLVPFVCDVVEHGSTVLTDGWGGYNDLPTHGSAISPSRTTTGR